MKLRRYTRRDLAKIEEVVATTAPGEEWASVKVDGRPFVGQSEGSPRRRPPGRLERLAERITRDAKRVPLIGDSTTPTEIRREALVELRTKQGEVHQLRVEVTNLEASRPLGRVRLAVDLAASLPVIGGLVHPAAAAVAGVAAGFALAAGHRDWGVPLKALAERHLVLCLSAVPIVGNLAMVLPAVAGSAEALRDFDDSVIIEGPRESTRIKQQLELLGLPTIGPKDATLEELEAWRRQNVSAMTQELRTHLRGKRPQFDPETLRLAERLDEALPEVLKRQGLSLEKIAGQPVGHYQLGPKDRVWAAVAGAFALEAGIRLGSLVGGPEDLLPMLAAAYGGAAVADELFVRHGHFAADQVLEKRYQPGDQPELGHDFWLHHVWPSACNERPWLKAVLPTLPLSLPLVATAGAVPNTPETAAFLFAMGLWVAFAEQIHGSAHDPSPSLAVRWGRKVGLFVDPDYHGLHHNGDGRERWVGEEPPRHIGHYAAAGGFAFPSQWLDRLHLHRLTERLVYALTRKDPTAWQEHPYLKAAALAPRSERPRILLAGRLESYRRTISWYEEEQAAAERSLGQTSGPERARAEARHQELRVLLTEMRATAAQIQAELGAVDLPMESKDAGHQGVCAAPPSPGSPGSSAPSERS